MTVPHRDAAARGCQRSRCHRDPARAAACACPSARRLVLEALFAAEGPVGAEAIAGGLGGRLPGSDLASVYRNLDTLEQIGLVRHFHLGHGRGPVRARPGAATPATRRASAAARTARSTPTPSPASPPSLREACGYEARLSHFPIVGTCPECETAMHIPDGFLSPEVAAVCAVPAAGAVAYGLRRANRELDERRVPLLGVTAAFVFAAQMLNFPVAGGTSGHFLGAALAAILLGPWLAGLVLAVVLVVQAFVFADGGITALGANVLEHGRDRRAARRRADARRPSASLPNRRGVLLARRRRRRVAGRRGRRRRDRGRARDLGHRAARHRPAGDARRARR